MFCTITLEQWTRGAVVQMSTEPFGRGLYFLHRETRTWSHFSTETHRHGPYSETMVHVPIVSPLRYMYMEDRLSPTHGHEVHALSIGCSLLFFSTGTLDDGLSSLSFAKHRYELFSYYISRHQNGDYSSL